MKYEEEDFKAKWPEMFEDVYCGFYLPPGWGPLVYGLCLSLGAARPQTAIKVSQVKEKFGGLRFYVDNASEKEYLLIHQVEDLSHLVCTRCSSMQEVETRSDKTGGWVRTLCRVCRGDN